jgi:hypothetical protein
MIRSLWLNKFKAPINKLCDHDWVATCGQVVKKLMISQGLSIYELWCFD